VEPTLTPFVHLVQTSHAVAQTSKRREKMSLLASQLRELLPEEVETGVCYLMGEVRQGRIGIGYARLSEVLSNVSAAESPTLTVLDVDAQLAALGGITGSGSSAERSRQLAALMTKATRAEQDFLFRLLTGELRQGALEGVMVDALAQATQLPGGPRGRGPPPARQNNQHTPQGFFGGH
jgi:DNA ligase 1